MALKENLNAIKQELSTQEQFLEGMIKSERFFKKYKWVLAGIVAVAVLFGAFYAITDTVKKNRLTQANLAYRTLLINPQDAAALEKLKASSPSLYATYRTKLAFESSDIQALEAVLASDVDVLLRDLASYQLSGVSEGLLANLAALQQGYELLQEGKVAEARSAFALISMTSPLQSVVKNLEHFQGE